MNTKWGWMILTLFTFSVEAAEDVKYDENIEINARLERLEIENGILAAKLKAYPSADVTALSDSITSGEDAGYFSSVLNFEALDAATAAIEKALSEKVSGTPSIVMVSGGSMVEFDALYQLAMSKSKDLLTEFCRFNGIKLSSGSPYTIDVPEDVTISANPWRCPEPADPAVKVAAIVSAIPAIIGFGAQLVSYFNVERTISAVSTKINESAIEASMTNALLASTKNWTVRSLEFKKQSDSSIIRLIQTLGAESIKASNKLAELESFKQAIKVAVESEQKSLTDVNSEKENESDPAKIQQLETKITQLKNTITQHEESSSLAEQMIKRGRALQTSLGSLTTALEATGSDKSQANLLYRLVNVEYVRDTDYGLTVTLEHNGGEMQTTDSLWTHARISYLGGVTLSYKLVDYSTGVITATGLVTRVAGDQYKTGKGPDELLKNKTLKVGSQNR